MLRDREGNKILLSESENFHIKAIGRSGCGKTFWACRYIEKLSKSVPVIIFDYSGSYSDYSEEYSEESYYSESSSEPEKEEKKPK